MDAPSLQMSLHGSIQLSHNGYNFCKNKKPKNKKYHFCCNKGKGKNWCKATAIVEGPLEEGMFKLVVHKMELHNHEPDRCTLLLKKL